MRFIQLHITATILTALLVHATSAPADILVRQRPQDAPLESARNTMEIDLATTADDFRFTETGTIHTIAAFMYVDAVDPLPDFWELEIRPDAFGEPGAVPWFMMESIDAEPTGDSIEHEGATLDLFRVTFDVAAESGGGLDLDPGRWWVIVRGADESPPAPSATYWAIANCGRVDGNSALLQSEELGFTEWTPWPCIRFDCVPIDAAWEMEGAGGGVLQTREAPAERITLRRGTGTGTLTKFRRPDGHYYLLNSSDHNGNQSAILILRYRLEDPEEARALHLRMFVGAAGPPTVTKVFIRNRRTRVWELARRFTASDPLSYRQLNILDEDDYISDAGVIEVLIRADRPDATPFTLNIDLLRVDAIVR